jgi:hypothetical protein
MRILIITIIFLPLISYGQVKFKDKRIDTFLKERFDLLYQLNESYAVLNQDSIAHDPNLLVKLEKENEAIMLFEKLTGIKAKISQTFFAKVIDKELIERWRNWTIKNRDLLFWDPQQQSINRSDKDIYLTNNPTMVRVFTNHLI